MKMKFGAIVVAGSGKIGGHVASKNRGGAYLRTKVTPANARTSFQSAVRNLFTQLSQAWRSLTENQRKAWNAAVTSYSRTDVFGDLRNPSGINLFQRLNNNRLSVGLAVKEDPPIPVAIVDSPVISADVAAGASTVELNLSGAVEVGTILKVFATPPLSAGKSFVKSEFRQIHTLVAMDGPTEDISAQYIAKFGSVGVAGEKIFFKTLAIAMSSGQSGTPAIVSTIVVA
jgi:hypothetical protein